MMDNIMELWNEYYPVVMVLGGTIVTIGTGIFAVYVMVKPMLDKIKDLKTTIVEKSDTVNPLDVIAQNTMLIDLKAKLDNPTISPELKLLYQEQYYELEKVLALTTSATDSVTSIVDKL